MPPAFVRPRCENSRPVNAKRKAATFRDGQSPLAKQCRVFGTDITNSVGQSQPRLVFKPADRTSKEQPQRPLQLLKDRNEQMTPVKFVEARGEEELEEPDISSSPLAKPTASETPLATLIETRLLELKTRLPCTEEVSIDYVEIEPWNAVCALADNMVVMNPRKLQLEGAQIYRHSKNACIAGLW